MPKVQPGTITTQVLDPELYRGEVESPAAGATVVFTGVVRDHDPEATGTVTGLEYTAHPDAEKLLQEVVEEFNIVHHNHQDTEPVAVRVVAAHRIGELKVGDVALVVAVSAAHRSEAFGTCTQVVDEIKARVPIWKKQFTGDESHWVGIE